MCLISKTNLRTNLFVKKLAIFIDLYTIKIFISPVKGQVKYLLRTHSYILFYQGNILFG